MVQSLLGSFLMRRIVSAMLTLARGLSIPTNSRTYIWRCIQSIQSCEAVGFAAQRRIDVWLSRSGCWYSRRLRAASHSASSAASAAKTAATAKVVPKQSLPMQVSGLPPWARAASAYRPPAQPHSRTLASSCVPWSPERLYGSP